MMIDVINVQYSKHMIGNNKLGLVCMIGKKWTGNLTDAGWF